MEYTKCVFTGDDMCKQSSNVSNIFRTYIF